MTSHFSPTEQAGEIGRLLARQRKSLRLTQKAAAQQSGVSLAMLRRAESRGTIPLPQLLKLAAAVNCRLHLEKENAHPATGLQTAGLNQRHPGLVWSNAKSPKEVYIRKALLNPRFGQLLKLAVDFGLNALKQEWNTLNVQLPGETQRVEAEVSRIFRNMEAGAGQAT